MAGLVETHVSAESSVTLDQLFGDSPTDLAFEDVYVDTYPPSNGYEAVKCGNEVRFFLPALDGGKVYLLHKASIIWNFELMQRINGQVVPLTPFEAPRRGDPPGLGEYKVALINNTAQSFISKLDLQIQETIITNNSANEAHINFVQTLTNFDALCKATQLNAEGWTDDNAKEINSFSYTNVGWYQRFLWFFKDKDAQPNSHVQPLNKPITLVSRVLHPLSQQNTPIPQGCKIFLRLHLNEENFLLQQDETVDFHNYVIKFNRVDLKVPYAILNRDLAERYLTSWKKDRLIKYHYRRYLMWNSSIPGSQSMYDAHFVREGGDIPSRVILLFIQTSDLKNRTKTPFYFRRCFGEKPNEVFLESIEIKLNGKPLDNVSDKITENDCMLMYVRFLETGGFWGSPVTNSVTYDMFKSAYFMASYDLSIAKQASDPFFTPICNTGTLTCKVTFSKILGVEVTVMAIMEYPCTMTINHLCKVNTSFKV